jgi:hypothetical protein
VLQLMRERGLGDRLLTGGGIIPPEDMETLARSGVGKLFGPGASTQDIAKYIRGWFDQAHAENGVSGTMSSRSAKPAVKAPPAAKSGAVAKRVVKTRAAMLAKGAAKPTRRRARGTKAAKPARARKAATSAGSRAPAARRRLSKPARKRR